ncbi:MAG: LCP family protein, partial [Dehalococcoidia bacterium]
IDHYIVVDWVGFVELIDALGGIDVEVPKAVSEFNTDVLNAWPTKTVPAGLQHMDGAQALGYSRTRIDGDLNRISRQQLVIRAAASKALSLGLVSRLPEVWDAYSSAIKTDVTTGLVPGYALLAQQLDLENIATLSLGPAMHGAVSEDNQAILVPNFDEIYAIIDEFMADAGVRAEAPRIAIEYTPGQEIAATLARDHLARYGVPLAWMALVEGAAAPPGVFDLGGADYSALKMTQLFKLQLLNPDVAAAAMVDFDIVVRIGEELESRSP